MEQWTKVTGGHKNIFCIKWSIFDCSPLCDKAGCSIFHRSGYFVCFLPCKLLCTFYKWYTFVLIIIIRNQMHCFFFYASAYAIFVLWNWPRAIEFFCFDYWARARTNANSFLILCSPTIIDRKNSTKKFNLPLISCLFSMMPLFSFAVEYVLRILVAVRGPPCILRNLHRWHIHPLRHH